MFAFAYIWPMHCANILLGDILQVPLNRGNGSNDMLLSCYSFKTGGYLRPLNGKLFSMEISD